MNPPGLPPELGPNIPSPSFTSDVKLATPEAKGLASTEFLGCVAHGVCSGSVSSPPCPAGRQGRGFQRPWGSLPGILHLPFKSARWLQSNSKTSMLS